MFKRKTIRIKRPPEEFASRYGSGAVRNPWWKIEQLAESREHMKGALGALHKQLEELYRKEILAYLAEYGVHDNRNPYFGKMPRREHEGATYIELPEGWKWEHRADMRTWIGLTCLPQTTVLYLVTPNGAELARVESQGFRDLVNQPFAGKDIYMACVDALKQVLPSHIEDKPAPLGALGGANES